MINKDNCQSSISLPEIQRELETSRTILKALFSSLRSSIVLVTPDFRILFFNQCARDGSRLFYSKDLFIGDSIFSYRRQGDEAIFSAFKANFEQALITKNLTVSEHEVDYLEKSFWIRSEYTPVYDGDKPIGVMLHIKNITDQKEYKKRIEKLERQLEHIAWLQSHHTRQPLATLLGLVNILDKDSLTAENREVIDMLEETALKLEMVIRQMVTQASSNKADFMADT